MTKLSKLFVVIGCLSILAGVIHRLALCPIIIAQKPVHSFSFLILANTLFLFALLSKR
jgi:hypothetical protein